MKKLILIVLALVLLGGVPVFAVGTSDPSWNKNHGSGFKWFNNHHHQVAIDDPETRFFDQGFEVIGVLYETPNTEVYFKGNHLKESEETRAYIGVKVYFNRMFWQKDK